jgi:hypothetical protein
VSSYEEGAVGGDSPTRLIRFPGDPAMPAAETPLIHSLAFGELLVASDVVEMASRLGDIAGLPFERGEVGAISGEGSVEGGDGLEERPLVLAPSVNKHYGEEQQAHAKARTPTRTW